MATVTWGQDSNEVFIDGDRYRYVPPTAHLESRGGQLVSEGRPDVERITKKEWEAIGTALGAMLAGSQDDWDMTDEEWQAVQTAHRKVGGRF